jgi:hypothetical protein
MHLSRPLISRSQTLLVIGLIVAGCTQWRVAPSTAPGSSPEGTSSTATEAVAEIPPSVTPSSVPAIPEDTATATALPTATATPTPAPLGPSFAPGINPLTGLAVADPVLLERRPMGIKVSNFPRSLRPHSGLSFADLVFEYYTERA